MVYDQIFTSCVPIFPLKFSSGHSSMYCPQCLSPLSADGSACLRCGATPPSRTSSSDPVRAGGSTPDPTLSDVFAFAWRRLKEQFLPLLIIAIAGAAMGAVLGFAGLFVGAIVDRVLGTTLFSSLFQGVAQSALFISAANVNLIALRGQRPQVDDLLAPWRKDGMRLLQAHLLYNGAIMLGLVLLVLPGLYLGLRLWPVPFVVVDQRMDPMDALRESYRLTGPYVWTIAGMFLVSAVLVVLGVVLLLVGAIPAAMLCLLAEGALYLAIKAKSGPAPAPSL